MIKKGSSKIYPEPEVKQLTEIDTTCLPRYATTFKPQFDVGQIFRGLKRNSLTNAILTVLGFSLAYLENEMFYSNSFKSNVQISFLRTIVMLLSFSQAILVYRFFVGVMTIRIAYSELDVHSNR